MTVPKKKGRFMRRKVCRFCEEKVNHLDYKDTKVLKTFITERGKIIPRRISGACATHQRVMTNALKRARQMALIPYTVGK
jgi:small subunit ribosomal protein S18